MILVFFFAGLAQIHCPEWLPGTDRVLPAGVTLTKEQKLKNNLKCYCQIVKPAEIECLKRNLPDMCRQRTAAWVTENIANVVLSNQALVRRWRLMTIEP